MELNEILVNLGLDRREAALYLATLELGEASAKDIAKKAGIQRTYFYDISDKLIKSGFLKQAIKGKKRLFIALVPEKLLELEEGRLKQLKNALPQFKALFNTKGQKPKIFYYEGIEGIRQIAEDSLSFKSEILNFTTPRVVTIDQQRLLKEYVKKRIGLGIRARVVGEFSPEVLNLQKNDKTEMRETRVLPKVIFSSDVEIGIYANRVYIIDFKEEFGFIVEDSQITKTLKMIFEIIWTSGKIIETVK